MRRSSYFGNGRKNPKKTSVYVPVTLDSQFLKVANNELVLNFLVYLPTSTKAIQQISLYARAKIRKNNFFEEVYKKPSYIYFEAKKNKNVDIYETKELIKRDFHFNQKKLFLKSQVFKRIQGKTKIPFFFTTKILSVYSILSDYELDVFHQLVNYKIRDFSEANLYNLIQDSHIVGRVRRKNETKGLESVFVNYAAPTKYLESCVLINRIVRNKESTRVKRDFTTEIFRKYSFGLDNVIKNKLIPNAEKVMLLREKVNAS